MANRKLKAADEQKQYRDKSTAMIMGVLIFPAIRVTILGYEIPATRPSQPLTIGGLLGY